MRFRKAGTGSPERGFPAAALLLLCLFTISGAVPVPALSGEELTAFSSKTAAGLLDAAETAIREGRFSAAARALDAAAGLGADAGKVSLLRAALAGRKAALPEAAPALDPASAGEVLFKKDTLSGWKAARGKWEALKGGGVHAPAGGKKESLLQRSASGGLASRGVLSFRFRFQPGGGAGVVLGTLRGARAGVRFQASGVCLYDFQRREACGEAGATKVAPSRFHRTRIVLRDEAIHVEVDGRFVLGDRLPGFRAGRPAFAASGEAWFDQARWTPPEEDRCLEAAERALHLKHDREAAALLLRARGIAPGNARVLARLGGVLRRLAFEEAAADAYRAYLAVAPEPRDLFHRSARKEAEACLAAEAAAAARLQGMLDAFYDRVEAAGTAALERNDEAGARAALEALRSAGAAPERVGSFSARIFTARHGGGAEARTAPGEAVLFDGTGTDGWEVRAGQWRVGEEKILEGAADPGTRAVFEAKDLPRFERFYLHTRQRGTGAYLDQGIRVIAGGEAFDFHLYKGMVRADSIAGRKLTVDHAGAAVHFRSMQDFVLAANRWYDMDLLVDGNLVTCFFEGKPLFTKVLPAAVDTRVLLFVEEGRRGRFGTVALRPLPEEAAYRAFLAEMSLVPRAVVECEAAAGAKESTRSAALGRNREQPFAYGGRCLAGALDAAAAGKGLLSFRFRSLALEDAVLSLRYAAPRGGAVLRVDLDDRPLSGRLRLDATPSDKDFTYARLALGKLGSGWHTLSFAPAEGGAGVLLDRLVVTPSGGLPRDETKVVDSEHLRHFRIRLSPGVRLPEDTQEIFRLMEEIRAFMVEYYGFEVADPLYFNLIARECWADPHKGGYASGNNLYVPEDVTFGNIAVIMHEMSHNFDHGNGFNPPWFGEGKSFPCYCAFVERHKGEYLKYRNPFARADRETGQKAWKSLEYKGENLFQYWGTPKFPYWGKLPDGRDLTHLGYSTSNWFCWKLAGYLGEGWLRNYFALVRRDQAAHAFYMPRDRVQANSVIVDYFDRSSGKDAAAFFRKMGFHVQDIYGYDRIEVKCGEGDRDYLTGDEGSKVVPVPAKGQGSAPGKDRARYVEEGGFWYAFPVRPGTVRVHLTVTWTGRGTADAEGRDLLRRRSAARVTATETVLDDPALWADGRLVVHFAGPAKGKSKGKEGAGLFVVRLVLEPEP